MSISIGRGVCRRFPLRRAAAWAAAIAVVLGFDAGARAQTETPAGAKPSAPIPPESIEHDNWYVMELDGERAGWMRETLRHEQRGIVSASAMKLAFRRGAAKIDISAEYEFVETQDGKPVSMSSETKFAGMATGMRAVFTGDTAEVTTFQGSEKIVEQTAMPEGEWLTPAAAWRYSRERFLAGDRVIEVRTIDPSVGLRALTIRHESLGEETIEAFGRVVPVIKRKLTTDLFPGIESIDHVDLEGNMVRSEMAIGGLTFVTRHADKALALTPMKAPEIMARTLVVPDKPLANARTARRAVYRLWVRDGELGAIAGMDEADGPAQRVVRLDERSARATVDLDAPAAGPAPTPELRAACLESPIAVNHTDETIRELARRAVREAGAEGKSARARAEALRAFVHAFISQKSLDVGFATASEVARTRAGDCSEHAVLLAALLRAEGIPSRVVSGLLFVDEFIGKPDVFGYHMWTQALVEDPARPGAEAWMDADAVLPEHPFDAGHIALTISTMSAKDGGDVNTLIELIPLLGRLEVSIEQGAK